VDDWKKAQALGALRGGTRALLKASGSIGEPELLRAASATLLPVLTAAAENGASPEEIAEATGLPVELIRSFLGQAPED